MLKAKKYEFVEKFFEKMQRKGVPPRAITYKGSVAVSFVRCTAFMHCNWIYYLKFWLCS
jgi:pentatricopeptide repeat protein